MTDFPLPTAENSFVRELEDLTGQAPNFFISSTARHSLGDVYSIRGLTNGRLFTDPSVALYVDGVPTGSTFTYSQPLYAVDHIDLFRSPQATLVGRAAEGGLLEVHTRHADPREWHGEFSVLYGDFGTIEHRLWVGGPLIPGQLTLELGGVSSITQGFIDNTYRGGRRDDRDTLGQRIVLTWTPQPDWEIIAGYEGSRSDDGASRFTRLTSDPFQTRTNLPGSLELERHREWLTIAKTFETWKVSSVTAHSTWEVDPVVQDVDLSPRRASAFSLVEPEGADSSFIDHLRDSGANSRLRLQQEVWSQEVRFESLAAADAPWWKAGLFFQHERTTGAANATQAQLAFEQQLLILPPTIFTIPGLPAFGIPDLVFQEPNYKFQTRLRNIPLRDHTDFQLRTETWATYLTRASGGVNLLWMVDCGPVTSAKHSAAAALLPACSRPGLA